MPKIEFLLQGLNENNDHYAAIKDVFSLRDIKRCLVAIAFINAKGVNLMLDELKKASKLLIIFIGIRNGITSKQALELLIGHGFSPICVDTATQAFIFHPKVYLSENNSRGKLLVGSANFTPGGFIKNIEGSLLVDLNLSEPDDKALIDSVYNSFFEIQNNNPDNIFPVTDMALLDEMVEQGLLIDESDVIIKASSQSKQKGSREEQRKRMALHVRKISTANHSKHYVPPASSPTVEIINNKLVWKSKPLSRRDLSIPKDTGRTNLTGSMYFNRGDRTQQFDFQHYFRDEVFQNANWKPDDNPLKKHLERAIVNFRIIIKGIDHGVYRLQLSHNTRTDTKTAQQSNGLTQIHWGKQVRPLISQEDLLDNIMYLYAPEEGSNIFTIMFDTD